MSCFLDISAFFSTFFSRGAMCSQTRKWHLLRARFRTSNSRKLEGFVFASVRHNSGKHEVGLIIVSHSSLPPISHALSMIDVIHSHSMTISRPSERNYGIQQVSLFECSASPQLLQAQLSHPPVYRRHTQPKQKQKQESTSTYPSTQSRSSQQSNLQYFI